MEGSVIIFPVEHLVVVVFSGAFDPLVLRLDEPVPLRPARILLFHVPLLIRVSLLEPYQLVQISQHVYEYAGLLPFGQKVIQSKLDVVLRPQKVNPINLTNNYI